MTEIICTKCGSKCGFMKDTHAISLLREAAWREVNEMRNQRNAWRGVAILTFAVALFVIGLVSL